ncbi:hypothetical protein F5Y19DRAFT_181455 [Xylariaceae sp. FL1651]|nr:hypothetical protein F5Y19DRAFT_181455 [Xylariaceae sp. FL1651]
MAVISENHQIPFSKRWHEASIQIDSFNTIIKLTISTFNCLGRYGEGYFKHHSGILLNKPTEFVMDGTNANRVYFGNLEDMKSQMNCTISMFPGTRLPVLFPTGNFVNGTGVVISPNQHLNSMGTVNKGNSTAAKHTAYGTEAQMPSWDPNQHTNIDNLFTKNHIHNNRSIAGFPPAQNFQIAPPYNVSSTPGLKPSPPNFGNPDQSPGFPMSSSFMGSGTMSLSSTSSRKRKTLGGARQDEVNQG